MEQSMLSTILLIGIGILIISLIPNSSTPSCPRCGRHECGQNCNLASASFKGAYLGALQGVSSSLTIADTTTKSNEDVKNALVDNVVNPKQYLHINHKTKFSL